VGLGIRCSGEELCGCRSGRGVSMRLWGTLFPWVQCSCSCSGVFFRGATRFGAWEVEGGDWWRSACGVVVVWFRVSFFGGIQKVVSLRLHHSCADRVWVWSSRFCGGVFSPGDRDGGQSVLLHESRRYMVAALVLAMLIHVLPSPLHRIRWWGGGFFFLLDTSTQRSVRSWVCRPPWLERFQRGAPEIMLRAPQAWVRTSDVADG